MKGIDKRYIDLMKKVLIDYHRMEFGEFKPIDLTNRTWKTSLLVFFDRLLSTKGYSIRKQTQFKKDDRINGKDWPAYADTMIGMKRLDNLEFCIKEIIKNNIPGDFIETGVWRGGSTIFMKSLLTAFEDTERVVWVADSFEGLPKPNIEKYAADKDDEHYKIEELAVSQEAVQYNFQKYELLDDHVKFLKGWFKDTLPSAPIQKLALLRLDGDMYESTMDSLVNLYPKLVPGGYIIIDDWTPVKGCKLAVQEYREKHGINEEIIPIDWSAVYWKKEN